MNIFKWTATTRTKDIKPCFLFHKWDMVKDNGYTVYKECSKCKSRKFEQPKGGYQPIDTSWLTYLRDTIEE